MYRIFDKTAEPLSDIVVSAAGGGAPKPEVASENSEEWISMFDLVDHGGSTSLGPPSAASRGLLDELKAWFEGNILDVQRVRYSRPGRRLSNVEREPISRVHDDNTRYVLDSADFRGILYKMSGIRLSDPLREWIRSRSEEKIKEVSEEVARRLQAKAGFVKVRHSGDVEARLICWCAREPA